MREDVLEMYQVLSEEDKKVIRQMIDSLLSQQGKEGHHEDQA